MCIDAGCHIGAHRTSPRSTPPRPRRLPRCSRSSFHHCVPPAHAAARAGSRPKDQAATAANFAELARHCAPILERLLRQSLGSADIVSDASAGSLCGEARLSRLSILPREPLAASPSWVIEYGSLLVDCRDENDAKTIIRGLRYRGGLVARTALGVSPRRRIEGADLASWLSE